MTAINDTDDGPEGARGDSRTMDAYLSEYRQRFEGQDNNQFIDRMLLLLMFVGVLAILIGQQGQNGLTFFMDVAAPMLFITFAVPFGMPAIKMAIDEVRGALGV